MTKTLDSEVLAVVGADFHLSHNRPAARVDNWYEAMDDAVSEVIDIANTHSAPILIAGDLFHKWNSPPELVNWAIDLFPAAHNGIYAIVGQHDLPFHDPSQLNKSAFYTLEKSEALWHLEYGFERIGNGLVVHAFPYGTPIKANDMKHEPGEIHIALCHQYVWTDETNSYPDAPKKNKLIESIDVFRGYNAVFFGDNHIPFTFQFLFNDAKGKPNGKRYRDYACTAVNCGSLMRRNIDQVKHRPAVYLVRKTGEIHRHELQFKEGVFSRPIYNVERQAIDLTEFLESLQGKTKTLGDFPAVVRRWISEHEISPEVQSLLLQVLEESE